MPLLTRTSIYCTPFHVREYVYSLRLDTVPRPSTTVPWGSILSTNGTLVTASDQLYHQPCSYSRRRFHAQRLKSVLCAVPLDCDRTLPNPSLCTILGITFITKVCSLLACYDRVDTPPPPEVMQSETKHTDIWDGTHENKTQATWTQNFPCATTWLLTLTGKQSTNWAWRIGSSGGRRRKRNYGSVSGAAINTDRISLAVVPTDDDTHTWSVYSRSCVGNHAYMLNDVL
jgi:hypothetical protein